MIFHQPVLTQSVLAHLVPPSDDGLIIDATLGEGGHAEAFLAKYPALLLIGVDADASILEAAQSRLAPFSGRIRLVNAWFSDFLAGYAEDKSPDLILMDLGVSRWHYEGSARGFSFDRDEDLDMRLGRDLTTTAADIVNTADAAEIADILFRYGEEKFARLIASRIVRERAETPITRARRLANLVAAAVPDRYRHRRIHPATRTFQALRIAVNGELEQLDAGLKEALRVLKPGGRIGVITFHSLEDRIVKRFFRDKSKECTCPPEWPICQCGGKAELRLVTGKPVTASEEEASHNPASRSAKLRVAEKPQQQAPGPKGRVRRAKGDR